LVENCISKGEQLFEHYKIKKKIDTLFDNWNQLTKSEREKKLNKIDKEATNLLLNAEKEYRKLRVGKVAFSPHLSKLDLT